VTCYAFKKENKYPYYLKRFKNTWRILGKAVMEGAYEDLMGVAPDSKVNKATIKREAQLFFESRRFLIWAKAADIPRDDAEQAYLNIIGKGGE